jgi:ribosomal protein S18 acetylase RimI-like enzyme
VAFVIEPLGKHHNRTAFSCGRTDLDDWFHRRASQDERRNIARVFVASDGLGIIGFYSLSSFTLSLTDLPDEIARKLPRYDAVPAALIGRLARDVRVRGQGFGELLLADAIRRILGAGSALAVFAIVVDAKDAAAAAFYEEFGFRSFPLRADRLFLLTSSAAAAIEKI